ncbi:MAG TPA: TonB-dependent receptor [Gemmatimonadaceae bacterium]|nr:TonB-dependent receptor [Gemmatimonadaceae bacterium]
MTRLTLVRVSALLPALPLLALLALAAPTIGAQQGAAPAPAGRITGRIIDARTGGGITDVGVQVVGTTLGTTSGIDGRFAIPGVPAGTVTIQARRIGYGPKTVTGLQLDADQTLEQDITLAPTTVELATVTVSAANERGSVNAALDEQRTATGIVNSVTAEQISKSADADAAQAVQRVSGVTVQDGRYVFVRGLGERYTTASLNGARLPSTEPERKVVPLDLFPAGLLQSVTTSKTFTPDQPGDFAGASVDIRTREFPAKRQVTWSSSAGMNDRAAGRDVFYAPGVGGELFALAGSARALPGALRAAGNFQGAITSADQNRFINSLRDVWQAERRIGTPNGSLGASVGGSDGIFGQQVGYLVSGTYSYSQEVQARQVRALARPASAAGDVIEYDRFDGATGRNSTLWGGLVNLGTLVGARSRLAFNNTYNRTADNDARVERGSIERYGSSVDVQRLDYVQRSMFSSQLAGEHDLGARKLDWALTASGVTRDEPDRSELVYQRDVDPSTGRPALLWFSSGEGAVRTFSALSERSYEARANYQFELGTPERSRTIKVGALGRTTARNADTRAYQISSPRISLADRALPPEQLFDGRFTQPDSTVLNISPLGQGGAYTASDRLAAGYAMADVALGARLRAIGGARLESSQVTVDASSTLGTRIITRPTWTDVLGSFALDYKVTGEQNLRLSATRTLARPEYRELAPLTTRDVIGGVLLRGNPGLVRTRIDNLDARWEWYPAAGEILSAGVFAKRFLAPIERVYQPTSNGDIVTFANADRATDYGVELEARKSLGILAEALHPLYAFGNVTAMRSEVTLGGSQGASTNSHRRLAGQAPYVLNAGLTWSSASGAGSATVLYNRVGERIINAGANPLPDVIEHPRDVLDVALRMPLVSGISARIDAKNLLDARYQVTQGSVTREAWNTGRGFTFGLTWQPR